LTDFSRVVLYDLSDLANDESRQRPLPQTKGDGDKGDVTSEVARWCEKPTIDLVLDGFGQLIR
jgi:hypothetical protein